MSDYDKTVSDDEKVSKASVASSKRSHVERYVTSPPYPQYGPSLKFINKLKTSFTSQVCVCIHVLRSIEEALGFTNSCTGSPTCTCTYI